MKNKLITLFIVLLLGLIIGVVILDYMSERIENRPENKYELNLDSIKSNQGYNLAYDEVKQIKLGNVVAHSIDVLNGTIYLALDSSIQLISGTKLIADFPLASVPRSIKVMNNKSIILVFKNHFVVLDSLGKEFLVSEAENDKAVFTSAAYIENQFFIADAGNRKVYVYNQTGVKINSIKGFYSSSNDRLGFIVPSPNFDLIVNNEGELWVVNPGIHALQQYSFEGDLIDFWMKETNSIEGFTGCCNPAHIAVMEDGSIVTAEKGIVRIKVYSKNGDLKSIVAGPETYKGSKESPDIAVENGVIYALDKEQKLVRIYKLKNNG